MKGWGWRLERRRVNWRCREACSAGLVLGRCRSARGWGLKVVAKEMLVSTWIDHVMQKVASGDSI